MTDTAPPIPFIWDGEAFTPRNQFWSRKADEHFVVGETYAMVGHHERSGNSHRHYFAAIHDAWLNLPEHLAERLPTSEHLRKFALIKAGYYDSRSIVCASKAEAKRVASFIHPMDDFAVVSVNEATVTVATAKSQSLRAMGKKTFQDSKQAVLEIVSAMVGVKAETLRENAGAAA